MSRIPREVKILIFFFSTIPLHAVFDGYTLSYLWKWFVVSTFHSPNLSVPAAMGISLIIRSEFLRGKTPNKQVEEESSDKDPEELAKDADLVFKKARDRMYDSLTTTASVLISGWVFHLFM